MLYLLVIIGNIFGPLWRNKIFTNNLLKKSQKIGAPAAGLPSALRKKKSLKYSVNIRNFVSPGAGLWFEKKALENAGVWIIIENYLCNIPHP